MSDNNLIYSKIYNKLKKVVDFTELKKTGYLKLKSNGFMDRSKKLR